MMQKPPQLKGHFLLGSALDFFNRPIETFAAATQQGDIVQLRLAHKNAYIVNHPDLIQDMLVKQPDAFVRDKLTRNSTRSFLGNGMVVIDGEGHRKVRKLVQPAFYHNRLKDYATTMIEKCDEMLARWGEGRQVNVRDEMDSLTLAIVCKALFGTDDTSDFAHTVITNTQKLLDIIGHEVRGINLPDWMPTPAKQEKRKALAVLNNTICKIIETKQKERGADLISALLDVADDSGVGMSYEQIRDQVITIFTAGHETSALALTWAFYILNKNPEVYDKIKAEVAAATVVEPLSLDTLPKLTYTEMVVKEILRMYPPAWLITRDALQDTMLGDYSIKKGSMMLISLYTLQRTASIFPDPDVFRPERFAPENEANIPRYGYIPFGSGPHMCMGHQFAMMEMKLILANIVGRDYMLTGISKNIDVLGSTTLIPAEPITAKVAITHQELVQQ